MRFRTSTLPLRRRPSSSLLPSPTVLPAASIQPSTSDRLLPQRVPSVARVRSPLWAAAREQGWNKNFANGRVHLSVYNPSTRVQSIARLSLPPKVIPYARLTKLSQLPPDSVEALAAMIQDSNWTPKMLQNEADTLSDKLEQRHFPASPKEVKRARREVLDGVLDDYPGFIYELNDLRMRPKIDSCLEREVQKRLAWQRYNWKPLRFKNKEQAIIYALSRFGGHFAEMRRVLAEFDRNGFVPQTVLDYGSGIGSAFWAAFERWGDQVREYSLMDHDDMVRHFSMDLIRGRNFTGSGKMVAKNVFFRKGLFPSPQHKYDLVILHRTLIELPSQEQRLELLEKLWQRTNKYLVIVESPMLEAFKALIEARDFILTAGYDFDLAKTKELLRIHKVLDQDTIELFADSRVETYEKYCVAREKLPEHVPMPTRVEPGHVFAPCPHDQGCPLVSGGKEESCKFMVRWQEFRADHRTRSPNKDGTETGKFSFLILAKGERPRGQLDGAHSRILELKRAHKCVSCRLCTPFDGVQHMVVSKRADKVYKRVRMASASQVFPVKFEVVKSDAEPQFIEEVRKITAAGRGESTE